MASNTCRLLCLFALLLGHGLSAKVIHVDDNATEGGDGSSWSTAHKYLQDALAVAESGDEVWVAEGTYKPDQGERKRLGERSHYFYLDKNYSIYGGFLGIEITRDPRGDFNSTILSGRLGAERGSWSSSVVRVSLQSVTKLVLNGFRITNGNSSTNSWAGGGGILIQGGYFNDNLKSEFFGINLVITENYAGKGGGIFFQEPAEIYTEGYIPHASVILKNCHIHDNYSSDVGGGIYYEGAGIYSPRMYNPNYNFAESPSSLRLYHCVIENNEARNEGGGVYIKYFSADKLFEVINNQTDPEGTRWVHGEYYSAPWDRYIFSQGTAKTRALIINNTVISNNSAGITGGAICSGGIGGCTLALSNCILINDSSDSTNSIARKGFRNPDLTFVNLTNCLIISNKPLFDSSYRFDLTRFRNSIVVGAGVGLSPDDWVSHISQFEIPAQYDIGPNTQEEIMMPKLNIIEGWEGDARAFDDDPLFVNFDDPDGPDDIWFTPDDGLRLKRNSPAIDAGYNQSLEEDLLDLDQNEILGESIPFDVLKQRRIIGSSVDIGPYEFDPDNPPPVVNNLLTLSTTNGGTVTGGGYYEKGLHTTIEAVPSSGYLFSNWSGDANGSTNPLSITMDSDKTITANFTQDLNDDDEDGLSNFDELITYGTNSNDPDSDDDGLLDGLEVEYDTNPLSSDIKVLNLVRDNPSVISTDNSSGYQDLLLGRDTNATPYTPSWFYIPDQGWMWSQKGVYPYFFDANSSNWMYFQSGHDNPRFYHYGTKEWMTLE